MAPSKCPYCNQVFSCGTALGGHIRVHDTVDSECPVCERVFPFRAALRSHMRIHRRNRASPVESTTDEDSTSLDAISLAVPQPRNLPPPFLAVSQPLGVPAPVAMQISSTRSYIHRTVQSWQIRSASASGNGGALAVSQPPDVPATLESNQRTIRFWQISYAIELQGALTQRAQNTANSGSEREAAARAQEIAGSSRPQQRPRIPNLSLPRPPNK